MFLITVFELLILLRISGNYPIYDDKDDTDVSKTVDVSQMFKEDAFNNISEDGKDFIRRLLTADRR